MDDSSEALKAPPSPEEGEIQDDPEPEPSRRGNCTTPTTTFLEEICSDDSSNESVTIIPLPVRKIPDLITISDSEDEARNSPEDTDLLELRLSALTELLPKGKLPDEFQDSPVESDTFEEILMDISPIDYSHTTSIALEDIATPPNDRINESGSSNWSEFDSPCSLPSSSCHYTGLANSGITDLERDTFARFPSCQAANNQFVPVPPTFPPPPNFTPWHHHPDNGMNPMPFPTYPTQPYDGMMNVSHLQMDILTPQMNFFMGQSDGGPLIPQLDMDYRLGTTGSYPNPFAQLPHDIDMRYNRENVDCQENYYHTTGNQNSAPSIVPFKIRKLREKSLSQEVEFIGEFKGGSNRTGNEVIKETEATPRNLQTEKKSSPKLTFVVQNSNSGTITSNESADSVHNQPKPKLDQHPKPKSVLKRFNPNPPVIRLRSEPQNSKPPAAVTTVRNSANLVVGKDKNLSEKRDERKIFSDKREQTKIFSDKRDQAKIIGDRKDQAKIIGDKRDQAKIIGDKRDQAKIIGDKRDPAKRIGDKRHQATSDKKGHVKNVVEQHRTNSISNKRLDAIPLPGNNRSLRRRQRQRSNRRNVTLSQSNSAKAQNERLIIEKNVGAPSPKNSDPKKTTPPSAGLTKPVVVSPKKITLNIPPKPCIGVKERQVVEEAVPETDEDLLALRAQLLQQVLKRVSIPIIANSNATTIPVNKPREIQVGKSHSPIVYNPPVVNILTKSITRRDPMRGIIRQIPNRYPTLPSNPSKTLVNFEPRLPIRTIVNRHVIDRRGTLKDKSVMNGFHPTITLGKKIEPIIIRPDASSDEEVDIPSTSKASRITKLKIIKDSNKKVTQAVVNKGQRKQVVSPSKVKGNEKVPKDFASEINNFIEKMKATAQQAVGQATKVIKTNDDSPPSIQIPAAMREMMSLPQQRAYVALRARLAEAKAAKSIRITSKPKRIEIKAKSPVKNSTSEANPGDKLPTLPSSVGPTKSISIELKKSTISSKKPLTPIDVAKPICNGLEINTKSPPTSLAKAEDPLSKKLPTIELEDLNVKPVGGTVELENKEAFEPQVETTLYDIPLVGLRDGVRMFPDDPPILQCRRELLLRERLLKTTLNRRLQQSDWRNVLKLTENQLTLKRQELNQKMDRLDLGIRNLRMKRRSLVKLKQQIPLVRKQLTSLEARLRSAERENQILRGKVVHGSRDFVSIQRECVTLTDSCIEYGGKLSGINYRLPCVESVDFDPRCQKIHEALNKFGFSDSVTLFNRMERNSEILQPPSPQTSTIIPNGIPNNPECLTAISASLCRLENLKTDNTTKVDKFEGYLVGTSTTSVGIVDFDAYVSPISTTVLAFLNNEEFKEDTVNHSQPFCFGVDGLGKCTISNCPLQHFQAAS